MLVALVIAGSSVVYGCSCGDPSVRQKFRSSDLIFVGEVENISDAPGKHDLFLYSVTLKVEGQWKGSGQSDVNVLWAFDNPGMCNDLPLTKGQRYLIYTSLENGFYGVYPDCGANYFAEGRSAEIAKLNSFWFRLGARLFPYPRL